MRIREVLFIIAAIIFTINTAFANSQNSINIALIADKSSGLDKLPLFSMLEAELSQTEGVKLLERDSIDKILEEQKLSASGLLDRNTTIKIGKLLRADAFIILSLENKSQESGDLIRVRVSETSHGLRLLDSFEQSNSKNPQEAVERIIQKIESVLNKINQPDEKLIPVGIVDIHRVQLGEQYKMLERTLPAMLSVRLSLEPQIIMLEREDLKVLLDEKLMTKGEDSEFWSSAILIDGYIQPNNGQLELHLNLKQASGDNLETIVVSLEPSKAVASIDKASTEIIEKLQDSPPTAKWNPEQEAEQFYKKAQMLVAHGRDEEALPLFETSHALKPQNVNYNGALFTRIWEKRKNGEYISPYSDIEIAELVSHFVNQIYDGLSSGILSEQDVQRWSKELGQSIQITAGYFASHVSVVNEEIKLLNRETRKVWIKINELSLQQQTSIVNKLSKICDIVALTWLSSDDPNELFENLKKVFTKYIMPPELGGEIKVSKYRDHIFREALCKKYLDISFVKSSHLKDTYFVVQELWQEYLKDMIDINDPVIQLNSCLMLSRTSGFPSKAEKEKAKYYIKIALKITRQQLHNTKDENRYFLTLPLSNIEKNMDNLNLTKDEIVEIWSEFYEPLIEKKDIEALAICSPPRNEAMNSVLEDFILLEDNTVVKYDSEEVTKKWYKLLKRIADVLESDTTNNKEVANALYKTQESIDKLRKNKNFSYLASLNEESNIVIPKEKSRIAVSQIFKTNQFKSTSSSTPVTIFTEIQNNMLWIANESHSNAFNKDSDGNRVTNVNVSLAGINLKENQLKSLWQTELPSLFYPQMTGLVINDNACYLSIINAGIVEFPGSKIESREQLSNPNIISINTGLPSNVITSIAMDNDKLWIAYGDQNKESGLGLFDPQTKHWESIFCSTIEGESLFNSGNTYQIKNLIISPKKEVFFSCVFQSNNLSDKVSLNEKGGGLWRIYPESLTLERLLPVSGSSIDISDGKLLISASEYIIEYDVTLKEIKVIYGNIQHLLRRFSEYGVNISVENLRNQNNKKRIESDLSVINLSRSAFYRNKFWACLEEHQIIIVDQDKGFDEAMIIDNNILDGKPVEKFVSTPYGLVGIGDGIVGLIETGD